MAKVRIAPLTEPMFESFRLCLDAVCREERYLAFTEAPPPAEAEAFLSDLIARGCPSFVALDGDRVVGWIDINIHLLPGFGHSGRLGMGLMEGYRGQGIGTELLTTAIADARRRGLSRIELQVFSSNTHAIHLYEKAGFVREGQRRRARILHDVPEDIIDMALFIA